MKKTLCLFEAGGTKTTLLIQEDGQPVTEHHLPGFNPNRYSAHLEQSLLKLHLPQNAQVFFYGSGLVSEQNKLKVREMLKPVFSGQISVFDDQLGAGRAAYGTMSGLVGIMGTGAFAAWYDGTIIVDRKGGHGYLIDDIGGGLELGKLILSAWLNHDLPPEIDQAVSIAVGVERNDFTTHFYSRPDLHLPARLPMVVSQFSQNKHLDELLVNYFHLYFSRHVKSLITKYKAEQMTLVGGLANAFHAQISSAALSFGINKIVCLSNPAEKLLHYHQDA
ncbi:MAG: hypothetical protein IPH66_07365 [Crocinitomicaceae bacterium]|nr:hypothetical protein [Crocinitomicaceae bacterium]